jgi:ABC-type phosphate/phosphonate transport system substrate-binding protein
MNQSEPAIETRCHRHHGSSNRSAMICAIVRYCTALAANKARLMGFLIVVVALLQLTPVTLFGAEPAVTNLDSQLPELRMAFSRQLFREISAEDGLAATHTWLQALGRSHSLFQSSKTILVDNVESLVKAGKAHQFDLVLVLAVEYLQLEERLPLMPWFTYLRGGPNGQRIVLLKAREEGVTSLESLRGKRLALTGGENAELATLWLETLLREHKQPALKDFFASMATFSKPSQVVLPVFFGQRDACAVTREAFDVMCELNPQVRNKLAVVEESPPLMPVVLCAHKSSDPRLLKRMHQVMATAHNDPWAKQIFITFRMEKLEDFDPVLFDNVRKLARRYQSLRGESSTERKTASPRRIHQ